MSEQEFENPGGEQTDGTEETSMTPEESFPAEIVLEEDSSAEAGVQEPEGPAVPDEPAAMDEPAVADEPAVTEETAVAEEAATVDEPAASVEPEAPDAAPQAAGPEIHRAGMNWYIIHTYSGFENKVAESLKARSEAYALSDRLGQVLIPVEEVIELRNGKKVTSKRMLYPGYVMVQVAMDDEIWHHIKNTPRVTGFVGGGNTPVPLSDAEVDNIFNRQASAAERPRPKLTFEKNETVRIVDGPFTNFQGKVDDINSDRNTLRVLVTIFGRATPVELEFLQVEKIN